MYRTTFLYKNTVHPINIVFFFTTCAIDITKIQSTKNQDGIPKLFHGANKKPSAKN